MIVVIKLVRSTLAGFVTFHLLKHVHIALNAVSRPKQEGSFFGEILKAQELPMDYFVIYLTVALLVIATVSFFLLRKNVLPNKKVSFAEQLNIASSKENTPLFLRIVLTVGEILIILSFSAYGFGYLFGLLFNN